jgi:hypothetical protein
MKYLIILSIFLISCSPQKRLQRLVKNNPELIRVDTIHFRDTINVITNEVYKDTLLTLKSISKDTLIITKENLRIKTFYNYHTDSIFISGECQSDTVFVPYEVAIPISNIVMEEVGFNWNKLITVLITILIIIALIIFVFKKFSSIFV